MILYVSASFRSHPQLHFHRQLLVQKLGLLIHRSLLVDLLLFCLVYDFKILNLCTSGAVSDVVSTFHGISNRKSLSPWSAHYAHRCIVDTSALIPLRSTTVYVTHQGLNPHLLGRWHSATFSSFKFMTGTCTMSRAPTNQPTDDASTIQLSTWYISFSFYLWLNTARL